MKEHFRRAAAQVSCLLGTPTAFLTALTLVLIWGASGPLFDYSNGWQLIINTGTTIGTFLMMFVLQNSQNRDTKAMNIKLDELLRAIEGARTGLADLNDASDEELEQLEGELRQLGSDGGAMAAVEPSRAPTTASATAPPHAPAIFRSTDAAAIRRTSSPSTGRGPAQR
jgi:low affinity Fe/Cu permease